MTGSFLVNLDGQTNYTLLTLPKWLLELTERMASNQNIA